MTALFFTQRFAFRENSSILCFIALYSEFGKRRTFVPKVAYCYTNASATVDLICVWKRVLFVVITMLRLEYRNLIGVLFLATGGVAG